MMSEFSFVKGRGIATNNMNMQPSCAWFESLGLEDYQGGQENMELIFNELEPLDHRLSTNSNSPRKIVDSFVLNFDQPQEKAIDNVSCGSNTRTNIPRTTRKNKHKVTKVVQQAGGDRIVSDQWNWRKYGEKVIKGSPYPRSYYKCSHPGGCLARKQVEQSSTDPGLFLITYMEEHTHPYPTRRHSQAGRSVRKFSDYASPKVLTATDKSQNTALTRIIIPSEPPLNEHRLLDLRGEDDGSSSAEYAGEIKGSNCIQDQVCEDDFFAGLDYLERLSMDFYS